MHAPMQKTPPPAATAAHETGNALLGDLRFRALLSGEDWARLPAAVRARFSKKTDAGQTVVYVGLVTRARMTRLGWLLAQICRTIGGPLPTSCDENVPSVVTVTEDQRSGGQIWTRLYASRSAFPQVIHSSKRFAGPTGLEEHVGRGIGMTLRILVEERALVFRSDRYFFEMAGQRLYLPRWMTPGLLTVRHTQSDETHFTFTLDIEHPRFGPILHQSAVFEETYR